MRGQMHRGGATASDARIPSSSIPTSCRARYIPMNPTKPLDANVRRGFPPVTVTLLLVLYLSIAAGTTNLIATLMMDADRRM